MAYKQRDFVELYSSIILSIIQGNDIISVAYIMQNIKPTSLGKKTKSESGLSLIKMFLFWPRSVIPFGHMLSINRIGLIVHELHFFFCKVGTFGQYLFVLEQACWYFIEFFQFHQLKVLSIMQSVYREYYVVLYINWIQQPGLQNLVQYL